MQYFRRDINTGETIKGRAANTINTQTKIKGIVSRNNAFDFYKQYTNYILPIKNIVAQVVDKSPYKQKEANQHKNN